MQLISFFIKFIYRSNRII